MSFVQVQYQDLNPAVKLVLCGTGSIISFSNGRKINILIEEVCFFFLLGETHWMQSDQYYTLDTLKVYISKSQTSAYSKSTTVHEREYTRWDYLVVCKSEHFMVVLQCFIAYRFPTNGNSAVCELLSC